MEADYQFVHFVLKSLVPGAVADFDYQFDYFLLVHFGVAMQVEIDFEDFLYIYYMYPLQIFHLETQYYNFLKYCNFLGIGLIHYYLQIFSPIFGLNIMPFFEFQFLHLFLALISLKLLLKNLFELLN